jgi:hypothetical protein
MNLLIHFKQTILPLLATIVLGCFMLLPQVQAVVPAPRKKSQDIRCLHETPT